MSITQEESALLDTELTAAERLLLNTTMSDLFAAGEDEGVPLAKDDRCARVEAALIRLMIESRA